MPANDFSIGKDIGFTVVGPYGGLVFNGVTDYSAKKDDSVLKHKGIDGLTRHAVLPDAWEVSIKLERQDPTVDRFFARLEADHFAGANIKGGTIVETIKEVDGTVSQYRYENVVLKMDGAGDYKGDSFVPVSLTAYASRRVFVA